jgi:predicted metal-dependent hydrolase
VDEHNNKLPNLMDRVTLIDIRDAAYSYADHVENENWKNAYRRLASAADHLDAMIARTGYVIVSEEAH